MHLTQVVHPPPLRDRPSFYVVCPALVRSGSARRRKAIVSPTFPSLPGPYLSQVHIQLRPISNPTRLMCGVTLIAAALVEYGRRVFAEMKSCCANQGLWTIPPAVALLAQDTPMRVGAGCRGPALMPELVADPRLFRSVECAGGAPGGTHDGGARHLGYASRNRLPTASAARRTSSLDVKRMHQFAALFYGCAEPRRLPERPARDRHLLARYRQVASLQGIQSWNSAPHRLLPKHFGSKGYSA